MLKQRCNHYTLMHSEEIGCEVWLPPCSSSEVGLLIAVCLTVSWDPRQALLRQLYSSANHQQVAAEEQWDFSGSWASLGRMLIMLQYVLCFWGLSLDFFLIHATRPSTLSPSVSVSNNFFFCHLDCSFFSWAWIVKSVALWKITTSSKTLNIHHSTPFLNYFVKNATFLWVNSNISWTTKVANDSNLCLHEPLNRNDVNWDYLG